MQLNKETDLSAVSRKTGFAIFELPEADFSQVLPKAYHFQPNDNGIYTKEEIDNISALAHSKQAADATIVIEEAEKMNANAANTFLKTLEEPGEHIHFVFLVRNASSILPTIKSRAHNYYLPTITKIADAPTADPEVLALAKQYITCSANELPKFCDKIAKDKKDARGKAIAVVEASIQLLYKSYFVTGKTDFLKKLDGLLIASDNLRANGHVKLQLVSGII